MSMEMGDLISLPERKGPKGLCEDNGLPGGNREKTRPSRGRSTSWQPMKRGASNIIPADFNGDGKWTTSPVVDTGRAFFGLKVPKFEQIEIDPEIAYPAQS
jgi:hypothetical protein